jgi:hypothetical protein
MFTPLYFVALRIASEAKAAQLAAEREAEKANAMAAAGRAAADRFFGVIDVEAREVPDVLPLAAPPLLAPA